MANKAKSNKSKRKRGKKFRAFAAHVQADAKGDEGNPFESHFRNVSHRKADEDRKGLVEEYKRRGKSGGILDRRFGEADNEHSKTVRYAIERNRNKKKMKFDLDSDSDDAQNVQLTHRGMALDDMYEFKDDKKANESDDYNIDDQIVERLHFGGQDINKEDEGDDFFKVKKTKEEVFKEIVTKSKIFKAAKADLKDQNDELIDKLDADFGEIFPLLNTKAKARAEKNTKLDGGVSLLEVSKKKNDKEISKKSEMRKRDQKHFKKSALEESYNYDSLQLELKNSSRARPHLLLKSEKEKALDRREELEKLEKQMKKADEQVEKLDQSSNENQSDSDEPEQNPEQLNDALVDLVDNEYGNDEAEDDFEAIEEESSDDE